MRVSLSSLNMSAVRAHYDERRKVHQAMRRLLDERAVNEFVRLALGISEAAGNYSAHEHGMGDRILSESDRAEQSVFDLAEAIEECGTVNRLPIVIYEHSIRNLRISIGSEIAMMLRPKRYWVGNVRTIWSHLVVKHNLNRGPANTELALYYDKDRDSEMDYAVWQHIYLGMAANIQQLGRLGAAAAVSQGVVPGKLPFMWADAVATYLFDEYATR